MAAFLAAALMVVGVMQVSVAVAQEEEAPAVAPPQLLTVDAGDDPFVVLRTAQQPAKVDITVGGALADTELPVPLDTSRVDVSTMIVIDNSAQASEFLDSFVDFFVG